MCMNRAALSLTQLGSYDDKNSHMLKFTSHMNCLFSLGLNYHAKALQVCSSHSEVKSTSSAQSEARLTAM